MSLPRDPKKAVIDLDIAISKLSAEEKLKRCQRRAYWIGRALNSHKPKVNNMPPCEHKKPFVIWFIVTMLINLVLMTCAWIKTDQHQNDTAINYLIVLLVVDIFASIIHTRMVRHFTENKQ